MNSVEEYLQQGQNFFDDNQACKDVKVVKGQKYIWLQPNFDNKIVLDIASACNLSIPIAHALAVRGFTDKKKVEQFLFNSFEKDVAHPSLLKDAEKAVKRILQAIEKDEKILVFGDYDVDGITSSAMMMLCLSALGANVNFFLPNRVKDGYGLSLKIVEKAAHNNYKVIITVDNGITAFEPAARAKELGIDLIITDHHRPHDHLPDAFAVIDPYQEDCPYPYKTLAGVGVTFKILSLLYEKKGLELPAKAYELLLLGTIADVVPITGENRFWVKHGLNYINSTESLSLKVLKQNSKIEKARIKASDIGFGITPQINALGRLEDPRQGVKFLIGSDIDDVEHVGRVLFELNQARKDIEKSILNEVEAEIQSGRINLEKENIILAASDNWPPGVIGLVASRLVSAYGKPTLLFYLTAQGIAKGSCRSISEFSIFEALQESSHLIEQFGGHAQAAGLSLKIENLSALKENLEAILAEKLTPFDLEQKLILEAPVRLSDVGAKFISDLEKLEPFGHQNQPPYFYVQDVVLVQPPQLLKDLHVKCSVFADGIIKPVIFFNRQDLFPKLMEIGNDSFDIAVQVVENHWNGRVNIELLGVDIRFK